MASTAMDPPLPPHFRTISQILDSPTESLTNNIFVSVIGYIKSVMAAIPSRGSGMDNWKSTITLVDQSMQKLDVIIFWAEDKIPRISVPGEVFLIRNAKIQQYNGQISLLANKNQTKFHLLKTAAASTRQRWQSWPITASPPNPSETSYCTWFSSQREAVELPTETEFQIAMSQTMVPKDKFALLKDVQPGKFYNILGEVIKTHEWSGIVTLYFSDYTPNSKFYDYPLLPDEKSPNGQDGDQYGYIKANKQLADSWSGPPGKMTIQISLFPPHARWVMDNIKTGNWVRLNNVQIDEAKQGTLWEGKLRTDRENDQKIGVEILNPSDDSSRVDDRLKASIRRKSDWMKANEKRKLKLMSQEISGAKRNFEDNETTTVSYKERRKKKRAENAEIQLNLNTNINCYFPEMPVISFRKFLEPQVLASLKSGDKVAAPFSNFKCKAHVRVVDYFPHRIEDFAVGRQAHEMDILSDYSGGEDTDPEEDMRRFKSGRGFGDKKWEWRFALQVEDASSKDCKDRLWLLVGNTDAQMLLSLEEDATNLRRSPTLLRKLKDQLFNLWGELEETKSAELGQDARETKHFRPSSASSILSSPPQRYGQQPDADSDDEMVDNERADDEMVDDDSTPRALEERDPNNQMKNDNITAMKIEPKNKAFTCCIKQYGIKVEENDPTKANAGNGQRWERRFGLFGTKIL